ncbi:Retrovirus-related Pol polyprotein from transposon opus, partial [Mucuna pruriens]
MSASILQAPNWALPFELMCGASNSALGVVLGQRVGKQLHVIAYVSRTMDAAQVNYAATENELLEIIFSLDMFRDKKGTKNSVADHLSWLEREVEPIPIRDEFPNEQILQMIHASLWYVDICNYLVASAYPKGASKIVIEKLNSDAKYYIWDDPYLWRLCNDQVTRRSIPESETKLVLHFCHSTSEGGHYGSMRTA